VALLPSPSNTSSSLGVVVEQLPQDRVAVVVELVDTGKTSPLA
jgi:hypothetical protein